MRLVAMVGGCIRLRHAGSEIYRFERRGDKDRMVSFNYASPIIQNSEH
jgi:hypothetical protein